jgi:hypothetical protein
MRFIIYNPKTELFTFFVNSLIEELNKYDIKDIYHIRDDKINVLSDIQSDIILILLNPHFIFDYKEISSELDKISKIYKYKILYITEPINFLVEKKVYQEIIKKINPYCLWTYTKENFNKVNTYLKTFKIYPSYNESINIVNISLENIITRNINKKIVFIGNITQNRKSITEIFLNNNTLIHYDNKWNKEEWTHILKNNLFYLNIHRRINCKSFETFRINNILANGGYVISERCNVEEEEYYSKYNIIFVERSLLYDTFINISKSIDYNDIYQKAILFRENMLHNNFDLDEYIKYHTINI